ncbi:photosystem I assembly protein Ycf4 [Synechococcus sp. CS-602]|uniref:photosystem I assembly protein Ycf4 n=2 Tax=Synechococcaceae TaxID=1890426 RepID=UPI0008FF11F0|nr:MULTISPECIES: photosystem I assembly protein Ycf4 [unclassified Synechococcus]MCT4364680.1 photosystem I assembly protein Ycf4 [Candidatus Regnicoccus frigidus MAG-AL1]NQV10211.1 photosystem I assembly protein Ycf4 [Cyanobacteria bacterium bin.51]APD48776.1 photosystem I assembly protein [Synechococcus sp. SynAce01]MCT0201752.1 photosystem I assembly protein Ycf4 [Synechococcus sp. CS-603]MCT0203882.1 photosystem I assembly protein Ycf4 [Synechococcus sp. CS-602]
MASVSSSAASPPRPPAGNSSQVLDQAVLGSRRPSNLVVALAVTAGGAGFLLASLSSKLGIDLMPIGHPAALVWVPQGLVMGAYGIAALLLSTYLWGVIAIDVGAGSNRFDQTSGTATISRRGFRQWIRFDLPLRDIQAVKVDVRDGINPRRRLALRLQGRRDLPLTRIGEPLPLAELEQSGAELARFLKVPLEGV